MVMNAHKTLLLIKLYFYQY